MPPLEQSQKSNETIATIVIDYRIFWPMNIELRWLRTFLATADELHFSRAARKLNLAQPALTAQIRQLEAAVGAPLFERTNRVGGLTAAGRALVPEARAIVERASALRLSAQRAAEGEAGALRLGVIPPAATPQLAEALRRFAARHDAVELSVRQGDQERLLERLIAKELDLLIGRPLQSERDDLHARRLFTEEQGVVLRDDDPLAERDRIPVRALEGRRLLLLRGNAHFGQLLLAHAAAHRATLEPAHVAEDFPSLHWMVRAGLGIAPCSLLLADGLPQGLVVRPLKPAPEKLGISAIWRGADPSPAAANLLRFVDRRR